MENFEVHTYPTLANIRWRSTCCCCLRTAARARAAFQLLLPTINRLRLVRLPPLLLLPERSDDHRAHASPGAGNARSSHLRQRGLSWWLLSARAERPDRAVAAVRGRHEHWQHVAHHPRPPPIHQAPSQPGARGGVPLRYGPSAGRAGHGPNSSCCRPGGRGRGCRGARDGRAEQPGLPDVVLGAEPIRIRGRDLSNWPELGQAAALPPWTRLHGRHCHSATASASATATAKLSGAAAVTATYATLEHCHCHCHCPTLPLLLPLTRHWNTADHCRHTGTLRPTPAPSRAPAPAAARPAGPAQRTSVRRARPRGLQQQLERPSVNVCDCVTVFVCVGGVGAHM